MNKILSLTRRCVEDYNMISPGDRVAVGVSGGKDSLMLLMALAKLREFYPVPFTLEAVTLDMGHADGAEGLDFSPVAALSAPAFNMAAVAKLFVPTAVIGIWGNAFLIAETSCLPIPPP